MSNQKEYLIKKVSACLNKTIYLQRFNDSTIQRLIILDNTYTSMGGATLLKSKCTTTEDGNDSIPSCEAKQLVCTPIIKGTGADKYSNS